jgi:hypothetical protein
MSQRYFLLPTDPRVKIIQANAVAFLGRLPLEKGWKIEVTQWKKERTQKQDNSLWGVAYPPIKKVTGYDVDELHTAMCGKFFGWVDIEIMGEARRRPFRTTTRDERNERDVLGRDRFSEFYAMVQREGAKIGIDVPDPDPFWNEKEK